MASQETNITNQILLKLSPMGATLWRNVRGLFSTLDGERKIKAGLQADGSSDLIGFTRVKITPEMVGRVLAVYTAIEVKTPQGRLRPEQTRYIDFVKKSGGFAGTARNDIEAQLIIKSL